MDGCIHRQDDALVAVFLCIEIHKGLAINCEFHLEYSEGCCIACRDQCLKYSEGLPSSLLFYYFLEVFHKF